MYLWLFGTWEPELTAFIAQGLRPGDAFLDVGANIGYFSVLAARGVEPSGSVIAVEASPAVFRQLEETIELNSAAGVIRPIKAAAGRDAGPMPIYSGPSHNIGLTTTVAERGFELEAVIPALPLDSMIGPDDISVLRMIKIDVEGREPDVLAGMEVLIRTSRQDLEVLIELSPAWWTDPTLDVPDVIKPFLNAGFNIYEIRNSYWPWRYLWPKSVPRPARRRSALPRRAHRLDLILSRRDVEIL
jgi:FkbM family methyltransferase